MKTCSRCGLAKPLTEFNKHKQQADGHRPECRACTKLWKDEFEKTLNGVVTKSYGNQRKKSTKRGHPMPTYTKDELLDWCENNKTYMKIYTDWCESGYKTDLKPSLDRIDDYKGYSLSNIQPMTWAENNAKGSADRVNGINNKMNKAVLQFTLDRVFVQEYHSLSEAARSINKSKGNIGKCCNGAVKTAYNFIWKYKE